MMDLSPCVCVPAFLTSSRRSSGDVIFVQEPIRMKVWKSDLKGDGGGLHITTS